jgi:photosystem II stability/assembly factor-like uncharacterized protein
MPLLLGRATLDAMRALLVLVLLLAGCTTPQNAAPSPIALPSFAQLSAPSGTVIWAIVEGAHLFRSTDRGSTWDERTLPTPLINGDVAFIDEMTGLLLSAGSAATQCQTQLAVIWRTTDGAASWRKLSGTGIAEGMCKRYLSMSDAAHGLLTAFSPNAAPVVYRTADGGETWSGSTPLPDPPGFTTQGAGAVLNPGRPRAFGAIVVVEAVGGGQGTRYVFRSTDSGATFAYASTVPTSQGSVAFVTAARWLVIATPEASKQTVDGGASWQPYPTDYSQAAPIAPDVVFGDSMVGYGTVRGAIQRTTDGGAHWTTIKTPGT